MHRVAVFVDAGYLFAQGGVALTGSKQKRADLTLDVPAVVQEFRATALGCAPGASLLRIYWYDGTLGGPRLTGEQALLANHDDVKVRLGFLNSAGQQKGVDSLIVTDLIELARQKAIYDAILLSGDEDVRVGVQIAQNYGVRIHLIGVTPARGSQSHQLMQEADTTAEWGEDVVRRFLSVRAEGGTRPAPRQTSARRSKLSLILGTEEITTAEVVIKETAASGSDTSILDAVAKDFIELATATDIEGLKAYWETGQRGLPSDLDRRLLPKGRDALGSDLSPEQKRYLRKAVRTLVDN